MAVPSRQAVSSRSMASISSATARLLRLPLPMRGGARRSGSRRGAGVGRPAGDAEGGGRSAAGAGRAVERRRGAPRPRARARAQASRVRSSRRMILPVLVFGTSSTNCTARGAL